jgi:hypothetical protein
MPVRKSACVAQVWLQQSVHDWRLISSGVACRSMSWSRLETVRIEKPWMADEVELGKKAIADLSVKGDWFAFGPRAFSGRDLRMRRAGRKPWTA